MATQRPISTISYNTEPFLRERLEELLKGHIIQAYQYIWHKGEDGDKDHIHVRIEPNRRVDQMDIAEHFSEYDSSHPHKPLGVRPFRNSSEEDWILYAVHDPDYMALKYSSDQREKIPYSWEDIKCNESYDVEVAFMRAKASLRHMAPSIVRSLRTGTTAADLVSQGENPFMISAVARLLQSTEYEYMSRRASELERKLMLLEQAIERANMVVSEDENGALHLVSLPS